jgi:hypothetical protein
MLFAVVFFCTAIFFSASKLAETVNAESQTGSKVDFLFKKTKSNNSSDIKDIILEMDSNIVLNQNTPANLFVGKLIVLTHSQRACSSLSIDDANEFFYLRGDKLFFRKSTGSSSTLPKNMTSISLDIRATDYKYPLSQPIKVSFFSWIIIFVFQN